MAGPAGYSLISILMLVVVGAGCLTAGTPATDSETGEAGVETLDFEWGPAEGETEFAYIAEVSAGPTSECTVVTGNVKGGFGHDSGIGTFFALIRPAGLFTFSAMWGEPLAAHAGPANSFQITKDAVTAVADGAGWGVSSNGTVQNETKIYLVAGFDLQREDSGPVISVACEGPSAHLRFYRALDIVPINSHAAKGGAGFHRWLFATPVEASVNHGDQYTMITEGQLTALLVREAPGRPDWPTDPVLEGQLELNTPQGNEVIHLEPWWSATRFWRGPGTYEVELDRVAVGMTSLVRLLAGYVLEEELGSPEGLPASRLDRTDPWDPES